MNDEIPIHDASIPHIRKAQAFELGRLLATPAALARLKRCGLDPLSLIALHAQREWGVLGIADRAANELAVQDGSRIVSAYDLSGTTLHVVTEAVGDDGHRKCTTVHLAKEY